MHVKRIDWGAISDMLVFGFAFSNSLSSFETLSTVSSILPGRSCRLGGTWASIHSSSWSSIALKSMGMMH